MQVAPAWYWGQVLAASESIGQVAQHESVAERQPSASSANPRVAEMRRRPRAREAHDDEDDQHSGTWVIRADEPQESVEDPFGLQRPTDRDDDADPEGLADSLSELPEARMVRTPGQAREVLRSGEDFERAEGARTGGSTPQRHGVSRSGTID